MESDSRMLVIENLQVYYGDVQALFGISLEVNKGGIISVVGANGAGKTTLMNSISGLTKNCSGKIIFNGKPVNHIPPHQRVILGIVQAPEGGKIFGKMTVLENLEMGSYAMHARGQRKHSLERVFDLFPRLAERSSQAAGTLSGGERQMLSIGRALMALPKLLLLDEPSLGLAPILVQQVFDTIKKISQDGVTILLVEQNMKQALNMADYGYVMENGRIVSSGSGQSLLFDDKTRRAFLGL
jgi:branched-chain amino acid transport system ATP-binding protein